MVDKKKKELLLEKYHLVITIHFFSDKLHASQVDLEPNLTLQPIMEEGSASQAIAHWPFSYHNHSSSHYDNRFSKN